MRIIVNGLEVDLPDETKHEYKLGPLRIFATAKIANEYNRVVAAHLDAQWEFEKENGFPWEPAFPLYPKMDIFDLLGFLEVGRAIEEAAAEFHSENSPPLELISLFMVPVFKEK